MKKHFASPELEIVKLKDVDILTSSGSTGGSTGGGAWGARGFDDFEIIDGDFE